jgi:Cof subfamily protein (haloacid dehalogenase superfamily)
MSSSLTESPAALPDALSSIELLEPFAQIELVVLDLDGTLLRDPDDLPNRSEWRLRSHLTNRLKSRGVSLTLATGRAFAGAKPAIEAISRYKDAPVILYNGSVVITVDGVLLAQRTIEKKTVNEIIDTVQRAGGMALFYWLEERLGKLTGEYAVFVGEGAKPETEFNGIRVCDMESIPANAGCVAALLWISDQQSHSRLRDIVSKISGISSTESGSKYIEVRPEGSSKAAGLTELLDRLHISSKNVMAIGDNDNDVELLMASGLSVCVANASTKAQMSSQFRTTFSSAQGVIEALQLVAHARRLWTGKAKRHGHE